MNNKKIKRILIAVACFLLGWLLYSIFFGGIDSQDTLIVTQVKRGHFKSLVFSTGQLQAESSVSINVPTELSGRSLHIYEINITDLIEEGTVVDSGEYVASLDHSTVEEALSDALTDLTEELEAYEDAKIDTNIDLSDLRDDLVTTRIELEETKLVLEQSQYESPSVIREAQLDVEKAERQLNQDLRNYELKKKQSSFTVKRAYNEVIKAQDQVADIKKLLDALDIKAPAPGMLIYSYDRTGEKIEVGSTVSRWAPTIAELPDLTSMISKTFINEIDISKIKVGQKVKIGVDAFPEKQFEGQVVAVANIGQVIPGGDAKVFEVTIKVFGTDPDLRPAMTTSNQITTSTSSDVLYVPLEAIFYQDSIPFVYSLKDKSRKAVYLGDENENFVIVKYGLEENEKLYLNNASQLANTAIKNIEMYDTLSVKKEEVVEEEEKHHHGPMGFPGGGPGGGSGMGGPPPGGGNFQGGMMPNGGGQPQGQMPAQGAQGNTQGNQAPNMQQQNSGSEQMPQQQGQPNNSNGTNQSQPQGNSMPPQGQGMGNPPQH